MKKLLYTLVIIVAGTSLVARGEALPIDGLLSAPADIQKGYQSLQRTLLPKVQFEDATLDEILLFIASLGSEFCNVRRIEQPIAGGTMYSDLRQLPTYSYAAKRVPALQALVQLSRLIALPIGLRTDGTMVVGHSTDTTIDRNVFYIEGSESDEGWSYRVVRGVSSELHPESGGE